MSISLNYLLATEKAINDSNSKTWSYINVIDNINIPEKLEFIAQDIVIAGKVNNIEAGNLVADVEILSPSGKVIERAHLEGELHSGDANLTAFFGALKISESGKYTFRVTCGGQLFEDPEKYYFLVTKS